MSLIEAVILAGGVGSRMNTATPKQFLEVDGAPVIVHTIKNFEQCASVTGVTVVCLPSWSDRMLDLVERYDLSKVRAVVSGGATGHESARNGVFSLRGVCSPDDLVIIHDAARPLVPQWVIDDMLCVASANGNACSAIPCYDTVIRTDDQVSGTEQIERSQIMRVQTPQAYRFGMIEALHERAKAEGRNDFVYANTMAVEYGERIYFSKGFGYNIKITTWEDMETYKLLRAFDEGAYER